MVHWYIFLSSLYVTEVFMYFISHKLTNANNILKVKTPSIIRNEQTHSVNRTESKLNLGQTCEANGKC